MILKKDDFLKPFLSCNDSGEVPEIETLKNLPPLPERFRKSGQAHPPSGISSGHARREQREFFLLLSIVGELSRTLVKGQNKGQHSPLLVNKV